MARVGRFFQEPRSSYFLFGPRGTGKSTWLKAHHPDALWVDLLQPDVHRHYAPRPERLRDLVRAHPEQDVLAWYVASDSEPSLREGCVSRC